MDENNSSDRQSYNSDYYKLNKEKIAQQRKERRALLKNLKATNPDYIPLSVKHKKDYRERHRERINAKAQEKYASDAEFKEKRMELQKAIYKNKNQVIKASSNKERLSRLEMAIKTRVAKDERTLFSTSEARVILGYGSSNLYKLLNTNKIKSEKIDGKIYTSEESLREYLSK